MCYDQRSPRWELLQYPGVDWNLPNFSRRPCLCVYKGRQCLHLISPEPGLAPLQVPLQDTSSPFCFQLRLYTGVRLPSYLSGFFLETQWVQHARLRLSLTRTSCSCSPSPWILGGKGGGALQTASLHIRHSAEDLGVTNLFPLLLAIRTPIGPLGFHGSFVTKTTAEWKAANRVC